MEAIFWYAAWPVVIFIAYKFVEINLKHFLNMERLEKIDKEIAD